MKHLLFGTELFQWLVQFVISVASIFVIVAVTYTMVKFSFKIVQNINNSLENDINKVFWQRWIGYVSKN